MAYFQIDLHTHTTASDGTHSPTELVRRAAQRGLTTLGIADHDTIDGLAEAQAEGARLGVEIVPAIELSTCHEPELHFIGIHLLGYFINPAAPVLTETIVAVKTGRMAQKVRQIELLQSFGFDIPVEAVLARVGGVPGRPHIAAVLLERNPGRFDSIDQIFEQYLGAGKKAHVARPFGLTVAEAIALVKAAGGAPVLAHPGGYGSSVDPVTVVRNAHAAGAEGVEVFYPYEKGRRNSDRNRWIGRMEQLARELNLLQTGGTDFHGRPGEVIDLGDMGLTGPQFASLRAGWRERRGL
jgi:hypothetical protein